MLCTISTENIEKIEETTKNVEEGLENTEDNIATVTKTFEDDILKEKILGINFGIIDIPEVSLAFDKVVSNIQITNAQGNILAEGNPATQNIKYVSDLDKEAHLVDGSQYTKSEINEDELYGSTLKLDYAITIQNNSEVNYFEKGNKDSEYYGYYYMFGEKYENNTSEVHITIGEVKDYLDKRLTLADYDHHGISNKDNYQEQNHELKAQTSEKIKVRVALKANIPVAIFSLEMSAAQLTQRILCSEAEIDAQRARTGIDMQQVQKDNLALVLPELPATTELVTVIADNAGLLDKTLKTPDLAKQYVANSNQKQIVIRELFQKRGEPGVKLRECRGIAVLILSMTVEHIKVNEVYKAKTVEVLTDHFGGLYHTFVIIMRRMSLCNSRHSEYIAYLTDSYNVKSFLGKLVKHRILWRN